MNRLQGILAIGFLVAGIFFFFTSECTAQLNFSSFRGELRYDNQYQDVLNESRFSSSTRQNPIAFFNISGNFISPRFLSFVSRTTLNGSFNSSHTDERSFFSKQYSWDYYNVDVSLFQYSPIKVVLNARDGAFGAQSNYSLAERFSVFRRQEQRISLSTFQVPYIPTTSFTVQKSRAWSESDEPYDQRSNIYTLGAAAANGKTAINMSGSMTNLFESVSGVREEYYNVSFSGTQELSDVHRMEVSSEYYRYVGFSSLSSSAHFSGTIAPRIMMSTSLHGHTSSGKTFSSTILGGAQTWQFVHNENFRYVANYAYKSGTEVFSMNGTKKPYSSSDWGIGGSIQHGRTIGFASISNSLSGNYSQQNAINNRSTLGGSFSNGMQATIGRFQTSANYAVNGDIVNEPSKRLHIGNQARITLTGSMYGKVHSSTSANYRSDRYFGNVDISNNRKNIQAQQTFRTSFYYYYPLTLSFGGTVNWFFVRNVGATYGWNVNATSSYFFVRNLTANYRYNRTFDPYYARHIVEQAAEFSYRWRALSFQFRLRTFNLTERRREVWFSVRRPF